LFEKIDNCDNEYLIRLNPIIDYCYWIVWFDFSWQIYKHSYDDIEMDTLHWYLGGYITVILKLYKRKYSPEYIDDVCNP